MKWIIRIVLVVVVFVAVLVGVAFWQMDRIATVGLQKATAFATQCDTEVQKVDLKPFSGEVEMSGLDIKNPGPFRAIQDSFFFLSNANTGVALSTLRSDMVEVPEVVLEGVVISLVGRDGKTNYETILESLKRLQGEGAPKQEGEEEGGKEFVIRTVRIPPAKVIVDMDEDPALGLAAVQLELTLKEIVLTDVGSGGVPLSQISADLIADILVQVVAQLGDQLGSRVLSGLTSGLSGVLGGDSVLQAQLTTIAADLNLSSTVDVAEQLKVAERLGTALEDVQDLIPQGGAIRDGLNNVIPGGGSGSNEQGEDGEGDSGEAQPGLGDRIDGALRGIGGE